MGNEKEILPISMFDIAEIIGHDNAVKLMDSVGGYDSFYIPKNPKQGQELAKIIDWPSYHALCRAIGGNWVHIPRGTFRRLKKSLILGADSKISSRRLSRILDVSQRYVRQIRNQVKDDSQLDLFGEDE